MIGLGSSGEGVVGVGGGGDGSAVGGAAGGEGRDDSDAQEMEQAPEAVRFEHSISSNRSSRADLEVAGQEGLGDGGPPGEAGVREGGAVGSAREARGRPKKDERSGVRVSDARGGFIGGSGVKGNRHRKNSSGGSNGGSNGGGVGRAYSSPTGAAKGGYDVEEDEMADDGEEENSRAGRRGGGGRGRSGGSGGGGEGGGERTTGLLRSRKDIPVLESICYDSAGDWASDGSDGMPAVLSAYKPGEAPAAAAATAAASAMETAATAGVVQGAAVTANAAEADSGGAAAATGGKARTLPKSSLSVERTVIHSDDGYDEGEGVTGWASTPTEGGTAVTASAAVVTATGSAGETTPENERENMEAGKEAGGTADVGETERGGKGDDSSTAQPPVSPGRAAAIAAAAARRKGGVGGSGSGSSNFGGSVKVGGGGRAGGSGGWGTVREKVTGFSATEGGAGCGGMGGSVRDRVAALSGRGSSLRNGGDSESSSGVFGVVRCGVVWLGVALLTVFVWVWYGCVLVVWVGDVCVLCGCVFWCLWLCRFLSVRVYVCACAC